MSSYQSLSNEPEPEPHPQPQSAPSLTLAPFPADHSPLLPTSTSTSTSMPKSETQATAARQKMYVLMDPFVPRPNADPDTPEAHEPAAAPRKGLDRFLGLFMGPADLIFFVFLVGTLPLYLIRLDEPVGLLLQMVVAACVGCARTVGEAHGHSHGHSHSHGHGPGDKDKDKGRGRGRGRGRGQQRAWVEAVLELYPAGLFAVVYTLMAGLCKTADGSVNDGQVQGWERRVFGASVSPAQDLWRAADSRALGEYLHVCYFSYYFVVAALPLTLFRTRSRYVFHRALGCLALVFVAGFATFIAFPVEGPYWQYDPPAAADTGYAFSHVTYGLVEMGSSNGTAFPSSHVAASLTCLWLALRFHRPLALAYAPFVPALCVATVYCGFHYAVDALAGLLYSLLALALGLPLSTALLHRLMPLRHDHPRLARERECDSF